MIKIFESINFKSISRELYMPEKHSKNESFEEPYSKTVKYKGFVIHDYYDDTMGYNAGGTYIEKNNKRYAIPSYYGGDGISAAKMCIDDILDPNYAGISMDDLQEIFRYK